MKHGVRRRRILLALQWYLESLHEGALRYANEQGWELTRVTAETLAQVDPSRFDGILSASATDDRPLYRYVSQAGIPVVELSYAHPEETAWCRYVSDHEAAGALAAAYLGRLGPASFVFLCDIFSRSHALRWNAFRSGVSGDPRVCVKYGYGDENDEALSAILKRLPKPVALFGSIDDCAAFALESTREAGLDVPGDVLILGFGDRRLVSGMASVPISSISIDYDAWAYAAMKLLHERLDGDAPSGTERRFPLGEVIERESTRVAAESQPLFLRVTKLMREHTGSPLSVKELAASAATSESTLRRVFAERGESVAAHYLALRIEVAKGLLAGGFKVESAAHAVGFASVRAFTTAFRKVTGRSPGSYRVL